MTEPLAQAESMPLYKKVRAILVQRIAEGQWTPGQLLPSESDIARELGVSQGTVRKALDAMTADHITVRKQGRGTFVATHDDARVLFQFFRLKADTEEPQFPDSQTSHVETGTADAGAAEALGLEAGAPIVIVRRIRTLSEMPCIDETLVLPAQLFPGIATLDLPNNLYKLYATRFGITIGRAVERIKATAASRSQARRLQLPAGTPLLQIDRVSETINGIRAEWRISLCRTDAFHYRADLGQTRQS